MSNSCCEGSRATSLASARPPDLRRRSRRSCRRATPETGGPRATLAGASVRAAPQGGRRTGGDRLPPEASALRCYKNGKLDNHDGAWRHGTNNARFGLFMPGMPKIGMRYHQEYAPKVAMDRAEVVSLDERSQTPAGMFDKCVKMKETTPLERFAREFKVFAPGIGLVQDGDLKLVSH